MPISCVRSPIAYESTPYIPIAARNSEILEKAPKERNEIAQGNALGRRKLKLLPSPKGGEMGEQITPQSVFHAR
jgi:hypothetical protein